MASICLIFEPFPAFFLITSSGNGHSVFGRISPALMPHSFAILTADFTTLAQAPYATTAISVASSKSKSSLLCSASIIFSYLLNLSSTDFSRISGCKNNVLTTLCSRLFSCPSVAHSNFFATGLSSGKITGSIICPSSPSARIITGTLYSSALSNASTVISTISCTEQGARTII